MRVACCVLDFAIGAFVHFEVTGAGRNGVGEEPVTPRAGEAKSARDARQPNLESRARGVGKHQGEVEVFSAEASGQGPGLFARGKGENAVEAGVMGPEVSEFLVGEEGDVGLGKSLAQTLESGRRHDGIAKPIDAAHEDAGRGGGGVQSLKFKVQSPISRSRVHGLASKVQSPTFTVYPSFFAVGAF